MRRGDARRMDCGDGIHPLLYRRAERERAGCAWGGRACSQREGVARIAPRPENRSTCSGEPARRRVKHGARSALRLCDGVARRREKVGATDYVPAKRLLFEDFAGRTFCGAHGHDEKIHKKRYCNGVGKVI